jgi:hypothetical protein
MKKRCSLSKPWSTAEFRPKILYPGLIKNFGMEYQEAYDITQQNYPRDKQLKAERSSEGNPIGSIVLGAVILTIGLVVTFGSGSHVIAYGAIIVGAIRLITGLMALAGR